MIVKTISLIFLVSSAALPPGPVSIARNSVSQKVIRIPSSASTNLQATAGKLAGFLQQMTGGTFTVAMFDPAVGPEPGIILGLSTNLNLVNEVPVSGTDMKIRERYLIATANSGRYLFLVGATDLAVQDAMYDLLDRLGCRWFFASPNWTVIPTDQNLSWTAVNPLWEKNLIMGNKAVSMSIYADELPDFKMRKFAAAYCSGPVGWEQQYKDWNSWSEPNRMSGGYVNNSSYTITSSHAYDTIINWIKAKGLWTNDYYSLINGVRVTNGYYQLCLSNTNLQQLMTQYAVEKLTNATAESVSMEPRDGGGWCQCAPCRAMQDERGGFVTERVVAVNNLAAAQIPSGKYIGMYAYNMHSASPTNLVSSNIYVQIATAFLTYGNTVDSLLTGWSAKAQNLGIRDYLSVFDWDHSLPGKAKAADLTYISERFPYYHASKADTYLTECTHSWGPFGLGFYIAAKKLWNKDADTAALKEDFLNRCFGTAAGTMAQFYERLDPHNQYQLSSDLMGRLYDYIRTARGQVTDPAVIARLDDLTLYLRYVELYRSYGLSETLLRFVWKIRNANMADSLTVWRVFDTDVGSWPSGYTWTNTVHPWKETNTHSHTEIVAMMEAGITNNPLLPEEPKSFSDDLVLSGLPAAMRGDSNLTRGVVNMVLRAGEDGIIPSLQIATGWSYTNKGDAVWSLYARDGVTLLESGTVPPDKTTHTVNFASAGENLYFFVYDDRLASSTMNWTGGAAVSCFASPEKKLWISGRVYYRYFYVPKGTRHVMAGAESIANCQFYTATGVLKLDQPAKSNGVDIVIPVEETEDDQIWCVTAFYAKNFFFWNIPGLLALNPDELLIPREAYANLIPADSAAGARGSIGTTRGPVQLYLHTMANGTLPSLDISTGWSYTNRPGTWELCTEDGLEVLQTGTIPPDKTANTVTFTIPSEAGTYLLKYDDSLNSSKIAWTAGARVSIAADSTATPWFSARASRLYFFVPKGTENVAFFAASALDFNLYTANGTKVLEYPNIPGAPVNVSVPVASGQDAQVWYMTNVSIKDLRFITVPGHVAVNADELLVPRWVFTD